MNRRDFLHPRRIASTAGQVLGALSTLDAAEPSPAEMSLLRLSRRAMATTFEIAIPAGRPQALDAAKAALDEIDRLEQQLTVFREDSEVSLLNQRAAETPVEVESGLHALLAEAARIHRETEGAFDISTGALINLWTLHRRRGNVPCPEELEAARLKSGMQHVALQPNAHTVRYLRSGLSINLGSIGKGYALDRAADILRRDLGLHEAVLHGGHSSVYAMGAGDGRGWPVGIRHPWNPERRLGVLRLRNQALGTSAATFQHLEYQGRKLGHILDPRTGWPAEGMLGASVVAATAAEADALATAFFILGVEKAQAYCRTRPDIAAVLLPAENDAEPICVGLTAENA
jgi:thiamine biosynthesis lipoprotein